MVDGHKSHKYTINRHSPLCIPNLNRKCWKTRQKNKQIKKTYSHVIYAPQDFRPQQIIILEKTRNIVLLAKLSYVRYCKIALTSFNPPPSRCFLCHILSNRKLERLRSVRFWWWKERENKLDVWRCTHLHHTKELKFQLVFCRLDRENHIDLPFVFGVKMINGTHNAASLK